MQQHIHTIRVHRHRMRVDDPVIVAGEMGHDAVSLDLDTEWDGLSVAVTFGEGDKAVTLAWAGEPVTIPAQCVAEPGRLAVAVAGYAGGGTVRVLTERDERIMRVVPAGDSQGAEAVPDTPDMLGQLVEARDEAAAAAEEAREAASLIPDGGEAGQVLTRTEDGAKWADPPGGGAGGTGDYETLRNLPSINGVTVKGAAGSLAAYGAAAIADDAINDICV